MFAPSFLALHMRLETMFFGQLEKAKKERTPLVLPVGTIEYHGPHCALGCDTMIAYGLLMRLEAEKEVIIAPPVWYGSSSYAVAGPQKGTIHVDADALEEQIYQILKSMLFGGFRNIYVLIHHQYEQETLLPMTLSCMKASKKLTFEFLESERGQGWWGDNKNKAFYDGLDGSDSPWNWITVLPCMSRKIQDETGYDHAGKWECSLLKALYPDAVDTSLLDQSDEWFIQNANESSIEIGERMVALCIEDLKKKIR